MWSINDWFNLSACVKSCCAVYAHTLSSFCLQSTWSKTRQNIIRQLSYYDDQQTIRTTGTLSLEIKSVEIEKIDTARQLKQFSILQTENWHNGHVETKSSWFFQYNNHSSMHSQQDENVKSRTSVSWRTVINCSSALASSAFRQSFSPSSTRSLQHFMWLLWS